MAILKIKEATGSLPTTLDYKELGTYNNKLYLGNSSSAPMEVVTGPINTVIFTSTYADRWYRIATIPMTSAHKQCTFYLKAYTPLGTMTEATVTVNLAYRAGSTAAQYTTVLANVSHSYQSSTTGEDGYVLYYLRVSFDATNGYIDIYKYKVTQITVESQPLTPNDWIWATGIDASTPSVAAGTSRSVQITLAGYGTRGNNIEANYAGASGYSSYGVLGTNTLSNVTTKLDQWAYFGNWYFEYNSNYPGEKSGNISIRLQELSYTSATSVTDFDDLTLHIKVNLASTTNSTEFNTAIPTFSVEVEGKTSINPTTDIAALVYSTGTSTKYIRFYIKLKSNHTHYLINPETRYGRSFNSTNAAAINTTSYSYFSYAGDQTLIAALPAPAQGSVVYGTWFDSKFGQITSMVADGTPPFVVSSSTVIPNLNVDILDGYHATTAATANTVVVRDNNNYIYANYINSNRGNETSAAASYIYDSGDGWLRKKTLANARTELVTTAAVTTAFGASLTTTFSTTSDILVPSSKGIYTWVTGLGYTTSSGVTSVTGTGAIASSGGNTPQISHSTAAGYIHIPSGGTTSQILQYAGSSGTAQWYTPPWTTNTGTVTSIAMSVPTGLSISGSPITTSGTLALTLTTGYTIPTTTAMANAATAYGWGNHASAGYTTSSGVTSVSLLGGTNNGTLKLTVNGSTTDNISVTGLGSAAYQASTAFAGALHNQAVLNGTASTYPSFFAPATGSTVGNLLIANGTGSTPIWLSNGTVGYFLRATAPGLGWQALSSADITTALGYTPYSNTNPSGYITADYLTDYLPLDGSGTMTGNLNMGGYTISNMVQIVNPNSSFRIDAYGSITIAAAGLILTSTSAAMVINNYGATISVPTIAGTINIGNTTTTASRIFLSTTIAGQGSWSSTSAGAAAYYGITDSTSASAISTGTNLPTERDIYYGLPTINGVHTYTSSTNIYAPITVGTSGWILTSDGSGDPIWQVKTPIGTSITASATLAIGHAFNCYVCTATTGSITITIPANTSVAFPVGTQIDFIRGGVAELAFTILTDTLLSEGSKRRVNAQNQGVSLIKTASTTWYLVGALKT